MPAAVRWPGCWRLPAMARDRSGGGGARPSGGRLRGGDPRRHRAARHGAPTTTPPARGMSLGVAAIGARILGLDHGGDPRGAGHRRVSRPAQPDDALHRPSDDDQGRLRLGRHDRRRRRRSWRGTALPARRRSPSKATTLPNSGTISARAGASRSSISRPIRCAAGRSRRSRRRHSCSATTALRMARSWASRSAPSTRRSSWRRPSRATRMRRSTACRFRWPRCWCAAR